MPQSKIVNRNSKIYKHLFFDLDHTIWDFDMNAEETLHELYNTYNLQDIGLHSAGLFALVNSVAPKAQTFSLFRFPTFRSEWINYCQNEMCYW